MEEGANWVQGMQKRLVNPIYKHATRSKLYGKKEMHNRYVVKDCSRPGGDEKAIRD